MTILVTAIVSDASGGLEAGSIAYPIRKVI